MKTIYDGVVDIARRTGIRQDAYAKAYPIAVEPNKDQPGTYLHPELFGQRPATGQE